MSIKVRAQAWAAAAGLQLKYAIAKDRISSMALKEKPDLGKDQLALLQATGSRLRVVVWSFAAVRWNARITATDHLDREPWYFAKLPWRLDRTDLAKGCCNHTGGWPG